MGNAVLECVHCAFPSTTNFILPNVCNSVFQSLFLLKWQDFFQIPSISMNPKTININGILMMGKYSSVKNCKIFC